jgi:hypothetical protein
MKDTPEIPAIVEPCFLAYNPRVTFCPVMNAQDLPTPVLESRKSSRSIARLPLFLPEAVTRGILLFHFTGP